MSNQTLETASRVLASLLGGPCAAGYVRQVQTLSGAAPMVEINFDLVMQHAIEVSISLQERCRERDRQEQRKAQKENRVFASPASDETCPHGIIWECECPQCVTDEACLATRGL